MPLRREYVPYVLPKSSYWLNQQSFFEGLFKGRYKLPLYVVLKRSARTALGYDEICTILSSQLLFCGGWMQHQFSFIGINGVTDFHYMLLVYCFRRKKFYVATAYLHWQSWGSFRLICGISKTAVQHPLKSILRQNQRSIYQNLSWCLLCTMVFSPEQKSIDLQLLRHMNSNSIQFFWTPGNFTSQWTKTHYIKSQRRNVSQPRFKISWLAPTTKSQHKYIVLRKAMGHEKNCLHIFGWLVPSERNYGTVWAHSGHTRQQHRRLQPRLQYTQFICTDRPKWEPVRPYQFRLSLLSLCIGSLSMKGVRVSILPVSCQ